MSPQAAAECTLVEPKKAGNSVIVFELTSPLLYTFLAHFGLMYARVLETGGRNDKHGNYEFNLP